MSDSKTDSKTETQQFDLVIIGGGSGGSPMVRRAVAWGASVCIIDRGVKYEGNVRIGSGAGGTCVNVGCIPKKIMWVAAHHAEMFHGPTATAGNMGFTIDGELKFDWGTLKRNRDAVVNRNNSNFQKRWVKQGGTLIMGAARFVDANTLAVTKNEDDSVVHVRGTHIVIATGGRPSFPGNTPGAEEHGVTSDNFFDVKEQPKKAVVIGAGYIAVEMAGILQALGTPTTLMCRGETVLRRGFDPFIVRHLMNELNSHGPTMATNSTVARVDLAEDGTKTLTLTDGKTLEGFDMVLFAIGRRPNTDNMGLEDVGVALNSKGFVIVDQYENTNVPNIHAVGDCTSTGWELTPVAIAAARRLVDRLFGGAPTARLDYANIATVVFSHPPIGTVGLTQPQAEQEFGAENIRVLEDHFTGTEDFVLNPVEERTVTAFKLVLAGVEEKVVGIHILGNHADEIIQGYAVALKMGATRRDFENTMAIHPTTSEELVSFPGWGKDPTGRRPQLHPTMENEKAADDVNRSQL